MEWRLTEERKRELANYRQKMLETDSNRQHIGQLVDGIETIRYRLANPTASERETEPETVKAGGKVVANKKVAVKRFE